MRSEEMLSQDQIDALLKGKLDNDYLNGREIDALGEIANISLGSSAIALSALLEQQVKITAPDVTVVTTEQISESITQPSIGIRVHYTQGIEGSNWLIFKLNDASIIADLMSGGDGILQSDEISSLHLSALQEAMSQMMGASSNSLASIFNRRVEISPPSVEMMEWNQGIEIQNLFDRQPVIRVSFKLKIGHVIDSTIVQLIPLEFGRYLINQLLSDGKLDGDSLPGREQTKPETDVHGKIPSSIQSPDDLVSRHSAQEKKNEEGRSNTPYIDVQPAKFASFDQPDSKAAESRNLAMLLDIPLQITVELGRTKRTVKEILALSAGSVIELDKLAGEPVDVLVNSRLIAKGEVVVIEENFGVRLTEIVSQNDRLSKLR
ncbi:flagellar motor switch phosphatase FliY [Jeotgalibacillus sp. S-D1]|uniref:flagellar motor switch phosphatase FliY n=1 Tax=Jeotgalibacillus sp. S-D1 TaxID=2552189 RepID=UPI00105A75B2|nr:flagellar motor switch phosphatase FliY [Jeotgalibacillus sp. S-D1]TDL35035.1 flagellar motor switch phosphatase FliY [Jeotgalibacillus sp. S-D1]